MGVCNKIFLVFNYTEYGGGSISRPFNCYDVVSAVIIDDNGASNNDTKGRMNIALFPSSFHAAPKPLSQNRAKAAAAAAASGNAFHPSVELQNAFQKAQFTAMGLLCF